MAEDDDYREADVYECQVGAHQIIFEDKLSTGFEPLQKEDWPYSMQKKWKGRAYDITGFYGQQVVALLSLIVNDKEQFKSNKTFYLLIRNSPEDKETEDEELFRLTAYPEKKQPGNGTVVLRPKGKVKFTEQPKKYEELNGALKAHYGTNTTSFAKDIKKLFKGNTQKKDIPKATIEAYMILLFEIARRLVKSENREGDKEPRMKEEFDLPIGSAIARFIKLLESGNCSFEDVFFQGGRFHCFSKSRAVRRKAIKAINEASAEKGTETEDMLLEDLQELFCSDQGLKEISSQEEDQLVKTSKNFENTSLNDALSDAESYTAL